MTYGYLSDLHTTVQRYYYEELYFNQIAVSTVYVFNFFNLDQGFNFQQQE